MTSVLLAPSEAKDTRCLPQRTVVAVRGFTLIELLVVIAIVVVLIALLVPTLQKAKDRSQASKCAANLHYLGVRTAAYASEWSGTIGLDGIGTDSSGGTAYWCPYTVSHSDLYRIDTSTTGQVSAPNWGYNPGYVSSVSSVTTVSGVKINQILNPASCAYYMDTAVYGEAGDTSTKGAPLIGMGLAVPASYSEAYNASLSFGRPTFDGRHSKAGNVLWYDGHVSAKSPYIPFDVAMMTTYSSDKYAKYNIGWLTPFESTMSINVFKTQRPTVIDQYFLVQ